MNAQALKGLKPGQQIKNVYGDWYTVVKSYGSSVYAYGNNGQGAVYVHSTKILAVK